jgi:hypothetical protein
MNRERYNRAWAFLTVVGALCILGWGWQERRARLEEAEPPGVNPDWVEGQAFAKGLPQGDFAACSRQFALGKTQRVACFSWLAERREYPPLPARGDWDSGKTGAQCREEVRQHYALQITDAVDMQDMHQAHLLIEREDDARRECRNYDSARLPRVIREPAARLEGLIERLQRGEAPSSAELEAVAQEERGARDYPAWPEQQAYLQRLSVFRALMAAPPAAAPASAPASNP